MDEDGPPNIAVWTVGIGVELQEVAKVVERAKSAAIDIEIMGSRNRAAAVHFDLVCALS